jgi:hypothetical protein
MTSVLTVVNQHLEFPTVSLIEPSTSAYLHVAAEIDARPAFLPSSGKKRAVIERCKELGRKIQSAPGVVDVSIFKAILVPPGRGEFIAKRSGKAHVARFDLAVLIECKDRDAAMLTDRHPAFVSLLGAIKKSATFTHFILASNVRRIAPVDHRRQGVFLFHYFFADDVEQNLAVWNYTAGWFQAETGLDNSTVLLPDAAAPSQYSMINHCRWDSLGKVLPSLLFKKTFRTYVLENFAANNVAGMPVLYRLV